MGREVGVVVSVWVGKGDVVVVKDGGMVVEGWGYGNISLNHGF